MATVVSALVLAALAALAAFVIIRVLGFAKRRRGGGSALPEELADMAEDVAASSRIAAALAAMAAFFLAPAGLLAFAAALGFVSPPLIVVLLPWVAAFAVGAAAVSAAAKLYAKAKRRRSAGK